MTVSVPVQTLPGRVRRHVAELAAAVLGELGGSDVPASLVRVRAFAPARRARAGGGLLLAALDRDARFRQGVGAAWRALHPDLAELIDAGSVPGTVDPALALAGVYLLRPPGWEVVLPALVVALERAEEVTAGQQADATTRAELSAAQTEVDRLRALLDAERARSSDLEEQLTATRRELRRLRSDADRARAQARAVVEESVANREQFQARLAEAQAAEQEAQERLRQVMERLEQSRQAEREGRSLADARVRLLLDTVLDAAAGLRRELALPPVEVHPADLVAGARPVPVRDPGCAVSLRGQDLTDPRHLARLLALPLAHLIVDGYNVTKSGYGTLPLAEQRRRLIESLTSLAARTGAEVTCCFDGAEVEGATAWRVRGVRVLFSDPGVTADELVRRLVRAEPPGRVVIVISTDGEVSRRTRAAGAHALPAQALLRLLSRA